MIKKSIDLKTILLSGDYKWDGNPPADEDDIAALIAFSPVPLPTEYLDLLRISDGGTAELSGYPSYVRIWSARKAIDNNIGYEVQQWLPGFVGFGDNGGPDMVGFDTRFGQPYKVLSILFVPMEWEDAMGVVADFSIFIRQLLPNKKKRRTIRSGGRR